MKRLAVVSILLLAVALGACAPPEPTEPPDHSAAAEAEVRAAVEAWVATLAAKDAEGFASFYAEGATLMFHASPMLVGSAAITETSTGMMQDPLFEMTFDTTEVVAAKSGELAYELGRYDMTLTGPDGNPAHDTGNYLVAWRKQADGSWKVAVDVPVSDVLPTAEATTDP